MALKILDAAGDIPACGGDESSATGPLLRTGVDPGVLEAVEGAEPARVDEGGNTPNTGERPDTSNLQRGREMTAECGEIWRSSRVWAEEGHRDENSR